MGQVLALPSGRITRRTNKQSCCPAMIFFIAVYPTTPLIWSSPMQSKRPLLKRISRHSSPKSLRSTKVKLKTSSKFYTNKSVSMTAKPKLNHSKSATSHFCSTPTTTPNQTKPYFNLSIRLGYTKSPNSSSIPTTSFAEAVLTRHSAFTECVSENTTPKTRSLKYRQMTHNTTPIHKRPNIMKPSTPKFRQRFMDQFNLLTNNTISQYRNIKNETNSTLIPMTPK